MRLGREGAVRFGFDRARCHSVGPPPVSQVRLGLATGLVVVCDLIGSGETQERGIVGETHNLAARRIRATRPASCAAVSCPAWAPARATSRGGR
jgi:class 3 adenylate cyclase